MQKFLKRLFSRLFFVGISIVIQILWFIGFVYLLGSRYRIFSSLMQAVCIIAVLWIVNKRINPAYKLAWTILILAVPVVGAAVYLLFGRSRVAKEIEENFNSASAMSKKTLQEHPRYRKELEELDPRINKQSIYLRDYARFPLYENTKTEYFPVGELLYKKMIEELEKAEHFIFLEYFIIDRGEMWQSILDILEEKAKQGLDVRLIYDDVGCVSTLPAKFYEEIRARGIQCEVFNRFRPVVSVILNNRDHRKIMVIDGHTGFTGGINLADEYINKKIRFGYWKDNGVMLKGEAVWNFTVMFLQMWSVIRGNMDELSDLSQYRCHSYYAGKFEDDGFVQPYSDTPLDHETVGENVYLNIINQAKKYVYIFTPYLIIDNEMMTCLCLASKGGVDVRIVTPGIPDKKIVFLLTQSYYEQLIDAGVKIYEYTPGFLHAKSFVCDDEVATVGTINMDYRSLYLHFECGVWMYRSRAVMQVKEDMINTLDQCRRVTKGYCQNRNRVIRLMQSLLRLMAPLM
ncbi:MAG: cardiolipin synthase [Lachnospiraceae bacterium]|nr:cardiolipin synthase [Lachnospiraceae bacterium]